MSSSANERLAQLSREIKPGSVWTYFDGGSYKIRSLELNATDYEETHCVGIVVVYEQLRAGDFPKGQIWVRSIDDFQSNVEKDGGLVPKFTRLRSEPDGNDWGQYD